MLPPLCAVRPPAVRLPQAIDGVADRRRRDPQPSTRIEPRPPEPVVAPGEARPQGCRRLCLMPTLALRALVLLEEPVELFLLLRRVIGCSRLFRLRRSLGDTERV